jgi:hypothetical protein
MRRCVFNQIRRVAEDLCQDQRRICSDGAAIAAELIDVLAGQAGTLRQFSLGKAERLQKLFDQNRSGG